MRGWRNHIRGDKKQYGALYMLQHYMNNTFASADYQKLSTAAIYMSFVMIVIMGILFWVEHHFGKDLEEE